MNLNKMFVFIFVFLGLFAVLLTTMPPDFIILGIDANVQDKEVRDYFDERDVTVYNNTLTLDLIFKEEQQFDFSLPEGQKLEFWWGHYDIFGDILGLRHLVDNLWGWWYNWHWLEVQEPYITQGNVNYPEFGLTKDDLLALFDEDYNASYCEFTCDSISVKLFVAPYDQSWTLSESWDNEKLKLYTSYNVDWSETGTSMWHIMFQLLAYQNPNLGIPGLGGLILGYGLSLSLTASILLLAFALITSVIPFIRGWVGGGG